VKVLQDVLDDLEELNREVRDLLSPSPGGISTQQPPVMYGTQGRLGSENITFTLNQAGIMSVSGCATRLKTCSRRCRSASTNRPGIKEIKI